MNRQMKFSLKDKKRIITVILAVILMGLALSFLVRLNFGADPFTVMNLGASNRLGISFGNWQVIFNAILFVIIILFDRSQIGWGTIFNMILVGYSLDFFSWVFDNTLPLDAFRSLSIRIIVLVPAILLFLFAAAVYLAVDLGSSPYDAAAFVLASKLKKVRFRYIRIGWDISAGLIGFLLGSKAIGIVTFIIAFSVGPIISWMKIKIEKFL